MTRNLRVLSVVALSIFTCAANAQTPYEELTSRAQKIVKARENVLKIEKKQLADQDPYLAADVNDEALDFLAFSKVPRLSELSNGEQKIRTALYEVIQEVKDEPGNKALERRIMIRYHREPVERQRQRWLDAYSVSKTPLSLTRLWILDKATNVLLSYWPEPSRDLLQPLTTTLESLFRRLSADR